MKMTIGHRAQAIWPAPDLKTGASSLKTNKEQDL